MSDENKILIGPYPCIISADGSLEDRLTCVTTPATDPNKLTDLAITIYSKSLSVTCNSANCAFSYQNSLTPFIEEIIPRSVVGGDKVYVYGLHRITQLGDGRSTSGT